MAENAPRILVGVTASIAAYRSCGIITALQKAGCRTKVVMSPDAGRFITALTLQTLSRNEVVTDMFKPAAEWDVCHVSLAEWADVILIAPATADIISKLACGSADCALSAAVLASRARVLIAPAMNENMYNHEAVRENMRRLEKFGYKFIAPKRGRLACGREGAGHIADTEDIVKAVSRVIASRR